MLLQMAWITFSFRLNNIPFYIYVCVYTHNAQSVMSDSLWPHGLQPARLLCPWNFPGKNIRVGLHFFLWVSSQPRDRTCVSRVSCTVREIFYQQPTHTYTHSFILYSFICGWTFRMLLSLDCCKQCCYERWGASFQITVCTSSGYMPRIGIAGLYSNSTFSFLRMLYTGPFSSTSALTHFQYCCFISCSSCH